MGGSSKAKVTKTRAMTGRLSNVIIKEHTLIKELRFRSQLLVTYFRRKIHLQLSLFVIAPPRIGPRMDAQVYPAPTEPRIIPALFIEATSILTGIMRA